MLVVMAEQTGLSIGKLFAGTIIPGFILSGLYICYTLYACWRHPHLGPAMPLEERSKYTKVQLLKMVLIQLCPPLILILSVLGVLFVGIATPTEAAATGCFFAFLLYVAYGRFNLKGFIRLVGESAKTSAMVLGIMVGANCFTAVFMGLGGGALVKGFLLGLGFGKWGTFIVMMVICFVVGMFLDWTAIVMITFPVFIPIIDILGFDKFWFVVTMAVTLQDTFCTPPFGYNLFYMKGCAPPHVTMTDIYLGAVPYWKLMEVGLVVVCVFPQTITWLPTILVRGG
jgi:tripartite ATP-independent transporter DctM subunit